MSIELDSTEVIAYMAQRNKSQDYLELRYSDIRNICRYVESVKSNVLVTSDMISIDAFRCSFPKHVVMTEDSIAISDLKSIRGDIKRLIPRREITDLMDQYLSMIV